MNKINTPIKYGLKLLAIFAFVLILMPINTTYAAYGANVGSGQTQTTNPKPSIDSISPDSSNIGFGTKTITITGNGFIPSSIVKINGSSRASTFIDDSHLLVQINGNDLSAYRSNGGFFITITNRAPGGGYSNAVFFTINEISASTTTNTNTINSNSSTTTFTEINNNPTNNETSLNTTTKKNNTFSGLAANVFFGSSDSFLPSGLVQWILLAIIILIIIILARKVFGSEENYHATPLKHE